MWIHMNVKTLMWAYKGSRWSSCHRTNDPRRGQAKWCHRDSSPHSQTGPGKKQWRSHSRQWSPRTHTQPGNCIWTSSAPPESGWSLELLQPPPSPPPLSPSLQNRAKTLQISLSLWCISWQSSSTKKLALNRSLSPVRPQVQARWRICTCCDEDRSSGGCDDQTCESDAWELLGWVEWMSGNGGGWYSALLAVPQLTDLPSSSSSAR